MERWVGGWVGWIEREKAVGMSSAVCRGWEGGCGGRTNDVVLEVCHEH